MRLTVGENHIPTDCDWMVANGFTDLLALPTPNTGKIGTNLEGCLTWSTRRPGGFTDEHIVVLRETLLSLSSVIRYHLQRETSKTLLCLYLGDDAGSRVFRGEIERGEGLVVRSVVWFSDIRGFTALSNQLPRRELIDLVNCYMQATVETVRKYGGQTLKMMGDGLMATFTPAYTTFHKSSL